MFEDFILLTFHFIESRNIWP